MRPIAILVLVLLAVVGCDTGEVPGTPSPARPSTSPSSTPATTVAPTPTPSATPAPSVTGELRWDRIGDVASESVASGGGPFGVVGFERGYVLIDMTSTVQFSPDGVTWTPVQLPVDEGSALGAETSASDGVRVLVAGSYTPCRIGAYEANPFGRCRGRPASWVSDDGLTWHSSDPWTGAVGPAGQAGSEFVATWAVPTGGWDAAQAFYTGDESDEGFWIGPALWHSEDGRAWSLLRELPAEPVSECDSYWSAERFGAVADIDGRRVAIEPSECAGESYLSTSTDGQRYDRIDSFPRDGGWMHPELAPIGAGPWVIAGGRQVSDSVSKAMIWTSGDLADWTTTVLPVPSDALRSRLIGAISHGAIGYVATGPAGAGGEFDRVITWLSDDGAAWRIADVQSSEVLAIEGIANGPAGMLGLGSVLVSEIDEEGVYRLDVWRLADLR
jgi:hypothetical protein